jgi:hypothetical protein
MDPIIPALGLAAVILGMVQVLRDWMWQRFEAGQAALNRHAESIENARDRAAKLMVLGHEPETTSGNGDRKEAVVPISESHSVSN